MWALLQPSSLATSGHCIFWSETLLLFCRMYQGLARFWREYVHDIQPGFRLTSHLINSFRGKWSMTWQAVLRYQWLMIILWWPLCPPQEWQVGTHKHINWVIGRGEEYFFLAWQNPHGFKHAPNAFAWKHGAPKSRWFMNMFPVKSAFFGAVPPIIGQNMTKPLNQKNAGHITLW